MIRGLCRICYQLAKGRGDLEQIATPAKITARDHPIGYSYINRDGYRLVKTSEGMQLEHRLVMADILGRPLISKRETVHHKNGNRSDNRPENLELWFNQPYGQRIPDLINYLVEFHHERLLATLKGLTND